jgi:DHA1 family inner membrane transport protein
VVALAALSASTFVYVTAETLPIGLLQEMSADLRVSPSAVGLLVTVYGLVVVVGSVPLTFATRRIPRRRLLPGLLLALVAASVFGVTAAGYRMLLGTRLVIALTQALFWSVVVSTAAGLFPRRMRGRVIAVVFTGSSLAAVVGVPGGTWLGQHVGWRGAYLALAGLALAAAVVLAMSLPNPADRDSRAAIGTEPDTRSYWTLLSTNALATAGAFTVYTYVSPFLTDVSGFAVAAMGPLLLIRGLAGIVGVAAGGTLADSRPWTAAALSLTLQATALLCLYSFGASPILAAGLVAVAGLALAALNAATATLVLHVAPGSSDIAVAGASTATNMGITVGALAGGALLPTFGVRSTALAGGMLSVAALVFLLGGRSATARHSTRRARTSSRTPFCPNVTQCHGLLPVCLPNELRKWRAQRPCATRVWWFTTSKIAPCVMAAVRPRRPAGLPHDRQENVIPVTHRGTPVSGRGRQSVVGLNEGID